MAEVDFVRAALFLVIALWAVLGAFAIVGLVLDLSAGDGPTNLTGPK